MKSLVRRIVELEQHIETAPIDLPPLPPPGASEEELTRAAREAVLRMYAHPHQSGWFLYLVRIAQRFGLTSTLGREAFFEEPEEHNGPLTTRHNGPAH